MRRIGSLLRLTLFGTMALGVLAFASVAQAEPPNWMVSGAELTAPLEPTVEVKEVEKLSGTEERHVSLLGTVAGVAIKILCEEVKLENVRLVAGGKLSEGKALFHKCKTYLKEVLSTPCEPIVELGGGVVDHGLVISELGKGHIALHEFKNSKGELVKEGVTIIESTVIKNGEPIFAVIHFGPECALGEEIPVLGKLVLKDALTEPGELQVEKEDHLISEHPLTELFIINLEAAHRAHIDGSALVRLLHNAVHPTWSGLPG